MGKEEVTVNKEEGRKMTPRTAVLYTRVSSREQEQEGFSLDAQTKVLHEYAEEKGFKIVQAFEDVETAKVSGRKQFGEMVSFFKRNRTCRTLLVEKTDRLYRNYRDAVTLEDLEIEIHFVKESQILSKDAKSQVKFMHDIRLAVARNYSENLREEVKKGMQEKAAQGTYPGRAPFGYRNNRDTRAIELHPEKSQIARYVFETYAKGQHSLLTLSKDVRHVWGTSLSKTNLHKMLNNPFYIGHFEWSGSTYQGTHPPLISPELYALAHEVMCGHNKPKYRKHEIAFRGLLTCAHDHCTVTGEVKKNKYVYYRCSGGRGPCDLPRFKEKDIAERLGQVLKDVSIPRKVARDIESALRRDASKSDDLLARERARLVRDLEMVRERVDRAYTDKLDGKISEEFWQRKQTEWRAEEAHIENHLAGLKEHDNDARMLTAHRILELAQNAHSIYLARESADKAELLRKVLLNCSIDAVSLYPTYRKPFDLIAMRVKNQEWSGREDLNLRPPGPEPGALPG